MGTPQQPKEEQSQTRTVGQVQGMNEQLLAKVMGGILKVAPELRDKAKLNVALLKATEMALSDLYHQKNGAESIEVKTEAYVGWLRCYMLWKMYHMEAED
ncbi:hypothetical protein QBC45DRAFT_393787 [Copromyces sp. CBS 386.78]|nr:hypothetical protein QBC45DRAFT_393787 [Copromyces sp. CBS 386.78]